MRAILIWLFITVGGGTVVALLRMAFYSYLYRRYRRWQRSRADSASGH